MKNWITFLLFLSLGTFTFAQDFEISEAARAKNNGTYNSYLFELPDVDKKTAEDQWKKFMKDFKGKSKYNKKSQLWTTEGVTIGRLSDDPINIDARIIEDNNPNKRTSVIVWFDLGDSYISSEGDSTQSSSAQEIVTEYAITTSKTQALAVVKEQEKNLSSLQKDLKKLEKDNKDFQSSIEKAKKTIAENEKKLEANEAELRNKKKAIEAQLEAVADAKDNAKKFN